jgi:hypothetical protein
VVVAFVAAAAAAPAHAGQSTSAVLVDRDMSAGAGATTMATFGEAVARAENTVVPHRLFDEHGATRRTGSIAYRLGRVVFFDAPQEEFVMVFNHEVFGHGARLRERFDGPIGYHFSIPSPYGGGGASTRSALDREPSPHEVLSIYVAGMEASAVAADVTASRAVSRGRMTPRDAMRYLEFELDTFAYVRGTDDEGEEPGHDVFDFLEAYNELASSVGASTLSVRTLKRQALVSLANPMLAYAAWGIGRYVATGATDVGVPMLTIAGVRYLPLFRYRLTPFGTEWALVNELGGRVRATQIEFRFGRALDARPWGIAVRQRALPAWRQWTLDLGGTVWRQPKFAASADEPFPPPTQLGVHVRGRLERRLIPVWFSTSRASLIVDIGVKSAGFVPGEPLGGGVIARAGIGLPLAP